MKHEFLSMKICKIIASSECWKWKKIPTIHNPHVSKKNFFMFEKKKTYLQKWKYYKSVNWLMNDLLFKHTFMYTVVYGVAKKKV